MFSFITFLVFWPLVSQAMYRRSNSPEIDKIWIIQRRATTGIFWLLFPKLVDYC
jgi:hypothetical protein